MVSAGDLGRILYDCVARSWSGSLFMLQVAQMFLVESRAESARSFLAALLHVAWSLAFASAFETPALTLCRHISRCLAMSSHALVSISADRKFCFMISLSLLA